MTGAGNSRPLVTAEGVAFDVADPCLPRHIAIIPDGNRRWAKARQQPVAAGYAAGINNLRSIIKCCKDSAVPALTVYTFSTENWQRSDIERDIVFSLVARSVDFHAPQLIDEGVRLEVIGDLDSVPQHLQKSLQRTILQSRDNTQLRLTLALNYGGRADITSAVQQIAKRVANGELEAAQICEDDISRSLSTSSLTSDVGDPDLLIRTSGEQRLSNYLLWQLAYTELYFAPVCWPDFGPQHFATALKEFSSRQRRFGQG